MSFGESTFTDTKQSFDQKLQKIKQKSVLDTSNLFKDKFTHEPPRLFGSLRTEIWEESKTTDDGSE